MLHDIQRSDRRKASVSFDNRGNIILRVHAFDHFTSPCAKKRDVRDAMLLSIHCPPTWWRPLATQTPEALPIPLHRWPVARPGVARTMRPVCDGLVKIILRSSGSDKTISFPFPNHAISQQSGELDSRDFHWYLLRPRTRIVYPIVPVSPSCPRLRPQAWQSVCLLRC